MKALAASAVVCALMFAGTSYADKPQDKKNADRQPAAAAASHSAYFTDDRVSVIRDYYSQNKPAKGCPPGLAKKNNGCQPPGQAKKWGRGDVLPPDVVYYDIPVALAHQLPRTPEGQKIVRVGTDLLVIAVGTGMIIDAIHDLNDVL